MRLAAIDIGTNSTRLLISEKYDSGFKILERIMEITRIGRNIGSTGNISRVSAEDTLETLKKYTALMDKHNVSRYRAIGTSAVRQSSNSEWFISYVYENSGIEIDTITGEEEARLSFDGASKYLNLYPEKNRKILVLDIGGGSTEFILGTTSLDTGPDIEILKSLRIGSVVLTEKFIKGSLPKKKELEVLKIFIRENISEVMESIGNKKEVMVIGMAGTITTLASIDLELKKYDSNIIHKHRLSLEKIKSIYKMLCNTELDERKKVIGLNPKRADIIIAGTAILLEILKKSGKDSLIVSEQDILDGIIYSLAEF